MISMSIPKKALTSAARVVPAHAWRPAENLAVRRNLNVGKGWFSSRKAQDDWAWYVHLARKLISMRVFIYAASNFLAACTLQWY